MRLPFPLFPPSASSVASEMDLLYLFIVAVSAFFVVLVAALVVHLRDQVPPAQSRRGGRGHSRIAGARADVDVHPVRAVDGDVRLGRGPVLPPRAPARRTRWRSSSSASSGCGRCSIPTGVREINEMHVPIGRNVRDHARLRGRHPRLLDPGVPREDGRRSRQADDAVVQGDGARHLPHLLRGVLRHEALGDDRPGHRDGRRRTTRRGSPAAGATSRRRPDGEKLFNELALRHVPQGRRARAAGRRCAASFGSTGAAGGRPQGRRPTKTTCASRS